MRSVWMYRDNPEDPDSDVFLSKLSPHFRVTTIPVLDTTFETLDSFTRLDPQFFESLIITSKRALASLGMLPDAQLLEWKRKRLYAVGPTTGRAALEMGFVDVRTPSEGQDAASLANLVLSQRTHLKVVFLCGNQRLDIIPRLFREQALAFEEVVAYTMEGVRTLSIPCDQDQPPLAQVFFSPSGVKTVHRLAPDVFSYSTCIALGRTTQCALGQVQHASCPPVLVCKRPDADSVLELLNSLQLGTAHCKDEKTECHATHRME
eukprot:ANDGO_02078.mRNA.1 Uroporphyrinogen-III synthase